MQDINPIRKTLDVKESATPDSLDLRASVGISNSGNPIRIEENSDIQRYTQSDTVLKQKEQIAFSSLYTPESRRNVVRPIPQNYAPIPPISRPKRYLPRVYTFLILSLAVLVFVLYTFVFGSSKVTLTPIRTNLDVNKVIIIPSVDIQLANNILTVTASSSDSAEVPRRGVTKVETKASGIITIYNSFDTNPQKLITNTRFETKEGKTYKISESVTVPGMKNGVPGSVEANVYADSIGSNYNLEQSEFTIPGFKGTPRYAKFSAKSKGKLSGGASGTGEAVADEDLLNASNQISQKIKPELINKIEELNPGDEYIYLPDSTTYTTQNNKSELRIDPKAKYTEELTAKAYFVRKTYLASKLLEGTNRNSEENLELEENDKLVFGIVPDSYKVLPGDIAFTVTGVPTFISNIDEVSIKSALTGKKKTDFQKIMTAFKGVQSAEVHFNPFWLRSFPNTPSKIKIELTK